jgi:sterol desaturase/sphingolipid hydroxylase (fatty acid hydroxylase superfamily)
LKKRSKLQGNGLPIWLNAILVTGTAVVLLHLERRRPLRRTRQDKLRRNMRNLAMSVTTAATVEALEKPLVLRLIKEVKRRNFGLLRWVRLPVWLELPASVALLDYTLCIWHYLTHKVSLLWRFHQVHHVDLDLDASTALRFHPGEMALSAPWRGAQVLLLGISPLALSAWQTLTLLAILFHHSNVELPVDLERRLSRVIVTPRMHGIHHSIVHEETDSNWATIFSWPDRLHGTQRLNVPQDGITIGVPAFQDPSDLILPGILAMPATADRPSWRFVEGGKPERHRTGPADRLMA